jgi:UDP-arabinose 4-epimerase
VPINIYAKAKKMAGITVKEFVEACKEATGGNINVKYLDWRPSGYVEVYSDP